MDSVNAWSTKEEVLRDLAEATGRTVGDLDEGYLVVGERPPPRHFNDEEDKDVELLFGGTVSRKHEPDCTIEPDLNGIAQMLRMVNDYNGEEGDHGTLDPENTFITITKPSNLNPNVAEFVPKGAIKSSLSSVKKNISNNVNSKTDDNTGKDRIVKNNIKNDISNKPLNSDDINDLATKLKNRISEASKCNTFQKKLEKNVAIATLLKLYASSSRSPSAVDSSVKLMTPQDFEPSIATEPDVKACSNEAASEGIAYDVGISASTKPSIAILNGIDSTSSVVNDSKTAKNVLHNSTNTKQKKIDPEVQASIEKVSRWLDEPEKKKSPSLFLEPVSFRRKESSPSKSFVSDTVSKAKKPAVSNQYQPSEYAVELGKKYMERSKKQEESLNIWENLEIILKKKDEEILRKRAEVTQTNGNNM